VLTALGFVAQHPSGRPAVPPTRGTNSPSRGTSSPTRNTRQWDILPLAPAPGKLAFASSFSGPATGWPTRSTTLAVNRYAHDGYVLHPLTRNTFDMVAAPSNIMTSVETVTATASLQSGQGIWGGLVPRYRPAGNAELSVWISHAGAVSIVTPQGQTPWVYLREST
jgi:hypothetical protein